MMRCSLPAVEIACVRVSFDDFEFDTVQFTLAQSGRAIAMEPQVFDVLAFLISHRDWVVSKEELLDGVWGDRFVSESAGPHSKLTHDHCLCDRNLNQNLRHT
jgi:DNA-binding winged helix-turn-helix (wHTH) protein